MVSNAITAGSISKYINLALIVAFAVFLRLLYLDSPIRYDEAFSYLNYIRQPFYVITTDYSYPNNHVLHSLLSKISVTILGASRWAIRVPAFVAGTLSVIWGYRFYSKLYDQGTALVITFGFAALPIMVDMSVNGRGYSLLVLCFLSSLLSLYEWFESHSRRSLTCSVISFAMGIYTIPIMIFYVPLMVALTLGFRSSLGLATQLRHVVAILCISLLVVIPFYLPLIYSSGLASVVNNSFVQPDPSLFHRFQSSLWLLDYLTISQGTAQRWVIAIGVLCSMFLTPFATMNRYIGSSILVTVLALEVIFGSRLQPRFLYLFTPFFLGLFCCGWMNIMHIFSINSDRKKVYIIILASCAVLWSDQGNCYRIIKDPIDDIVPNAQELIAAIKMSPLPMKAILTRARLHVPLAFELSMIGQSENIIHADMSEIKSRIKSSEFQLLLLSDSAYLDCCIAEKKPKCQKPHDIECIINQCFTSELSSRALECSDETRIKGSGIEALIATCRLST